MGSIHWVPERARNTYQRLQIGDRPAGSLSKYFPRAYSGLMLAAEGTEIQTRPVPCHEEAHFTSITQFHQIHIHTIVFYFYWFLGINIAFVRFVNPLGNTLDLAFFTSFWYLTE